MKESKLDAPSVEAPNNSCLCTCSFKLSYEPESIPTFDGEPANYPGWREEMQHAVLPGLGDAFAIRLMTKYSTDKGLPRMFMNQDKAWRYLDEKYANPHRVSNEFLALTKVHGETDEQKMVSLHIEVLTLYRLLKVAGKEKWLTDLIGLAGKAIRLMPLAYQKKFSEKIIKEEEKDGGRELSNNEMYELLKDFLHASLRSSISFPRAFFRDSQDQNSGTGRKVKHRRKKRRAGVSKVN